MRTTVQISTRTLMWVATTAVLAVTATLIVTQAWQVGAAPGDDDATFVPTPGCRAFDLRGGNDQVGPRSAPLGQGETYTQQITGGVGNCTGPLAIPSDAVAVAMNVTVVNPTAQSNLRLFPANLTEVPLVSNLNFSAGQAPFPNKVDVQLSPGGALKMFNQNGTVSVLGDIVGYYTNATLMEISAGLQQLADAQPFTVREMVGANDDVPEGDEVVTIPSAGATMVELEVTPKVSGQLTVTGYSGLNSIDPAFVACYISDANAISYLQQTVVGYPSLEQSQLSSNGVDTYNSSRVFDVVGGVKRTFALVCGDGTPNGLTFSYGATLIGQFTPSQPVG
ncbi:MAG: hypothetical protein AAFY28_00240 [Actinomycetota bacterium]